MSEISLSQLISQLREELTIAQQQGLTSPLNFEVGPVELTLTVAVTKEAKPGAKVRIYVIEAGAEARLEKQDTQSIKLTLNPVHTAAPEAGVSPQRFKVASEMSPGEA